MGEINGLILIWQVKKLCGYLERKGIRNHPREIQRNPMEIVISQQEQEVYFEIVKQIAPYDPEVFHELREGVFQSSKIYRPA